MKQSMIGRVKEKLQRCLDLALQKGASSAKAGFVHSDALSCGYESGRLKNMGAEEKINCKIEVLVNGKCGRVSGNDMDRLEELVGSAIQLGKNGSDAHFEAYPSPSTEPRIQSWSDEVYNLTPEKMIDDCGDIVSRLKDYNEEMDINAGASRLENEMLLLTTGGVCHEEKATGWSLGAAVQRTEGTDMLFTGFGRSWGDLNEFYDPSYIVGRVLEDLKQGERIAESPEGNVPAYLPPEVLQQFLRVFEIGVNGRSVAKGESPLRGKLGQQVLAPEMTVVDNPHRPFSPSAAAVDDDGVPTRELTLFDQGVLKHFLYDLDTAGLVGEEPTGHNNCQPYELMINPGDRPSEELLADIEDGIYIKHLLGFGQSNIVNGDFSANVGLGYRVRNGRIEGRVKNTMVAGNMYELFGRNVLLSSDVDPVSQLPCAVVDGISVSASGE